MTTIGMDPALWLRRFRPAPAAARRLVCFPHAGGSASFYHPVAIAHAPATDVVVLQYPGRQDRRREPGVPTVEAYADRIAEILAAEPALATVYFGHSMGASIAFETAVRLAGTAVAPRALIASGRRGPATVRDERVHQLDDAGIFRELKQLDGTEAAMLDNDEIFRMALPAIRNDYRAAELYRGRPGLTVDCPITVLLGEDDSKATVAEGDRWREHTTAAFRLRTFAGGHFFLVEHAAEVNGELAAELARVRPS